MKIADERDELLKERQAQQNQLDGKLLDGWNMRKKVIEVKEKTYKEYIEAIEKNPTKAFILKCKLEAYDELLKDGGE